MTLGACNADDMDFFDGMASVTGPLVMGSNSPDTVRRVHKPLPHPTELGEPRFFFNHIN